MTSHATWVQFSKCCGESCNSCAYIGIFKPICPDGAIDDDGCPVAFTCDNDENWVEKWQLQTAEESQGEFEQYIYVYASLNINGETLEPKPYGLRFEKYCNFTTQDVDCLTNDGLLDDDVTQCCPETVSHPGSVDECEGVLGENYDTWFKIVEDIEGPYCDEPLCVGTLAELLELCPPGDDGDPGGGGGGGNGGGGECQKYFGTTLSFKYRFNNNVHFASSGSNTWISWGSCCQRTDCQSLGNCAGLADGAIDEPGCFVVNPTSAPLSYNGRCPEVPSAWVFGGGGSEPKWGPYSPCGLQLYLPEEGAYNTNVAYNSYSADCVHCGRDIYAYSLPQTNNVFYCDEPPPPNLYRSFLYPYKTFSGQNSLNASCTYQTCLGPDDDGNNSGRYVAFYGWPSNTIPDPSDDSVPNVYQRLPRCYMELAEYHYAYMFYVPGSGDDPAIFYHPWNTMQLPLPYNTNFFNVEGCRPVGYNAWNSTNAFIDGTGTNQLGVGSTYIRRFSNLEESPWDLIGFWEGRVEYDPTTGEQTSSMWFNVSSEDKYAPGLRIDFPTLSARSQQVDPETGDYVKQNKLVWEYNTEKWKEYYSIPDDVYNYVFGHTHCPHFMSSTHSSSTEDYTYALGDPWNFLPLEPPRVWPSNKGVLEDAFPPPVEGLWYPMGGNTSSDPDVFTNSPDRWPGINTSQRLDAGYVLHATNESSSTRICPEACWKYMRTDGVADPLDVLPGPGCDAMAQCGEAQSSYNGGFYFAYSNALAVNPGSAGGA